MHALWWRIVFSILISNTDEHLRYHGFLTAIDLEDGTPSLKLALEVAAYFELGADEAHAIAVQVGQAVAKWRKKAAKLVLAAPEIDRSRRLSSMMI
jgi:serine/threonine-protein kinase HipA